MMIRWVFYSRVAWVGQVEEIVSGSKNAETGDVTFMARDLGWFARFEGSQERLYLGREEPELKVNDPVKIIIEKSV